MTRNNILLVLVSVVFTVAVMKIWESSKLTPSDITVKAPRANDVDEQEQNVAQLSAFEKPVDSQSVQSPSVQRVESKEPMPSEKMALTKAKPTDEQTSFSLVDESGSLDMDLATEKVRMEDFEGYINALYDPADEASILKQQYLTQRLAAVEGLQAHRIVHSCGQRICALLVEDVEDTEAMMDLLNKTVVLGGALYRVHTDEYGVKALRAVYSQENSSVSFSLKQPS